MVMHVFAAIMSFFAAFFLIRYQLAVAKQEERRVESECKPSESDLESGAGPGPPRQTSTLAGTGGGGASRDAERARSDDGDDNDGDSPARESTLTDPGMPAIFSSNPHLEQVGPFRRGQPPTGMLEHCHTLCMGLAAAGFVLALVGVGCLGWSRLALSGSAFASGCLGVCCVASLAAFFWPRSSAHGH